jgi:hypothetical protein
MRRKREIYVALGGLTGPAIAVAMLAKGVAWIRWLRIS